MEASSGGHIVPKIMTFRPTMDEFKDFSRYIEYIEENGGHRAGVCKVIPPKEWIPRRSMNYDDIDLVIPAPIQQMITGCQGLYQQYNIQRKPIHVTDFKKLANSDRHRVPVHNSMEELERKYWKNITFINPLYGADTSGTLTDTDQPYWNINHLGTILDCVNEDYGVKIEGVNTAYLYFGMWKTTFGWHTEDMDLYSINYLHFGAPKTWYSVPPEHGRRLERLAAGFFPSTAQTCAGFMRHKMTVISPSVLRKYSIPFDKIVHYPGEFMITFPYGYHAGFNNGYNCAESTNFATKRWIEYGKRCVLCNCSRDMVRISMDCFVKRYQPDKYELWKEGKDLAPHPEDDQSKLYPHSGRGAAQAKSDLLELGIIGAEVEPRKRKVKAIDTGVVSKKRHPLTQEFGDIPTALLKEDSLITKPPTVAKGKQKKCTAGAAAPEVKDGEREQNDKAMQDAVIAKIMASIKEQMSKKNEASATGDSVKAVVCQPSSATANIAQTLLQPNGAVHTVTTLMATSGSGVNCSPAQTGTHLVVTRVAATPPAGGIKNCSVVSQNNVTAVSLLQPTAVSSAGIAQQNGVQTIIADPAQLMAVSGGQLHLIGNQLVCIAPTTTVAASSSQPTKNLSGVVGTLVQPQPLQFSLMSQQVAAPTAMASVAMTTGSAPFLSSVSSVESGHTSATDIVTNNVDLTEVVVGGDENTDPPSMPLDDMLSTDEYDVPMYSETIPPDMDTMNATALEHAYFSSRTDVTPSQSPSQPAISDTDATKKMCKRKEKTPKSGVPAKSGRDKAATKDGGKQSPKEDPKTKRIAELEELMDDKRVEPWMRDMKRLLQVWPHDMDTECTYNEMCAEIEPYCCVCQLFRQVRPDPSFTSDSDDSCDPSHCLPMNHADRAQYSQPLIPNTYFLTNVDNQNPPSRNNSADLAGDSKLLVCSECKICVHASCYGAEEDAGTEWMCDRCSKHQPLAECCLCMLRGGALKPTTDGQWTHLVCALTIPEVTFEDITHRGPVNVDKVPTARKKLRCVHCHHIVREHAGACAQCSTGRCTTAFHVTCAHAAGATFELSDWPFPVYISCLKHRNSRSEPKHRSLPPVMQRDTVIAKHKNGRYYKCQVIDTKIQVFYEVDFADGSFSHDLFPEDIVDFECQEAGPPPGGHAVQVRWPDGVLYDATFRGTNSQDMYTMNYQSNFGKTDNMTMIGVKKILRNLKDQVEFEDGSEITLKRENIWSEQEELPKRVKSRISLATEMKHDIFSDENVSNKRVRRTTLKYSRD